MNNYYCKNCNNIVGLWDNEYKLYENLCYCIESTNFNSIDFLDCIKCKKFVGILFYNICINCFGEDEIIGEEKIFNWFLKYEKIIKKNSTSCKICNNKCNFKYQLWFFKELTFYK